MARSSPPKIDPSSFSTQQPAPRAERGGMTSPIQRSAAPVAESNRFETSTRGPQDEIFLGAFRPKGAS